MRILRDAVTGELYHIDDDAPGYDADHWTDLGPVPADFSPETHVWDDAADAYVLDLAPLELRLTAEIDAGAGDVRRRFITDVPGQQLVYSRKAEQARGWLADPAPSAGSYPALETEATASGIAIGDLVEDIIAAENAWAAVSDAIEAARMAAKRRVAAATTPETMIAAAQIDWDAVIATVGS